MTSPHIESNAPRRSRRKWIIAAVVAALGVCVCALLAVELFAPGSPIPDSMALATPNYPPVGAQATAPVTRLPSVMETPSGAGAVSTHTPLATATPPPTFAFVIGETGELKFDYPLTLVVDRDDIVKVEIIPDQPVAMAGGLAAPAASAQLLVEASAGAGEHKTVSYSIPVYAVMAAELTTARSQDLNISAGTEAKQMLAAHDSIFWTWTLVANKSGEYLVTLRVFGYNELDDADPVRRVVDDTRVITVQDRSLGERLGQGLADNWLVLFGAGGPIALALLLLTFIYGRRDAAKPKGGGM